MANEDKRVIVWNRRAQKDYIKFPEEIQEAFDLALHEALAGEHPDIADPYGPPLPNGVYKLKDADDRGEEYRGIYVAKFKEAVYVLHVFHKKSKSGRADPKEEIETTKIRFRWAEEKHADHEATKAEEAKRREGKR